MRIKFTETRTVNDFRRGTPDEERFDAGSIYDLPEASARRWLSRNVAVPAPEEAPSPASAVAIPDDWSGLKPKKLIALARALGADAKTAEEATASIEAEIERRTFAGSPDAPAVTDA